MAELQIKRANFPTEWAGSWSSGSLYLNPTQQMNVYVSALSFVVVVEAEGYVPPKLHLAPYYYRSNSWMLGHDATFYNGSTIYATLKCFHNRDTEKDSESGVYAYDDPTGRCAPLFRVTLTNQGTEKNTFLHVNMTVYYGGAGMLTDSEYDFCAKGRKIISNGTLDNTSNGFIYFTKYNTDDAGAIAKFNPENTRETVITEDMANHLMPKWN